MGIPKLNARPNTACGMDTTRLANGYATATASAAKDMAIVSVLVLRAVGEWRELADN
jgi:hypothetical protein